MARNKKAQILTAIMCASSIIGSYTVVSAAENLTVSYDEGKSKIIMSSPDKEILTISKLSGVTTLEEVSFAKGAINAKSALIGEIEITGQTVAGVNIKELRNAVAGHVTNIAKLGQKTDGIQRIGASNAGSMTTVVDDNLFVQGDLSTAGGKLRVDGNGNLKTEGDVVTLEDYKAGKVKYSLNKIGDNIAGISRNGETTTIEGNTSINKDGINTNGLVVQNSNKQLNNRFSVGKYGINMNTEYTSKDGSVVNNSGIGVSPDGVAIFNGKKENGKEEYQTRVTYNGNGTIFYASDDDYVTIIKGGSIKANEIEASGIIKGRDVKTENYSLNTIGEKIDGLYETNGDITVLQKKTQAMSYDARTSTTNFVGDVTSKDRDNKTYSLNTIGANTKGIVRNEYTTTIEKTTSFDANGMSMGDVKSGVYTAITPGSATFANDGNNGITQINGGTITTNTIKIGNNTIDDNFFGAVGQVNANSAGISRKKGIEGEHTTSIETTFRVHSSEGYNVGIVDVYGSMIESTLDGQKTVINGGSITTNSLTVGGISFDELVNRVDVLVDKTQNIATSNFSTGEDSTVSSSTTAGRIDMKDGYDNLTANSGTIGGVTMDGGKISVGETEGTSISKDGVTVGNEEKGNYTSITNDDVVINNNGNKTSLTDVSNRVTGLETSVNNINNRLNNVEKRIDKVGAMAAAIANLRTMGYDSEAPTEISIGIGQYKSETGIALGIFHYPNQDFMLSASISTSGNEVMGGVGATWKFGRKSAIKDVKDEEMIHLKKAEEMKKLAKESKIRAQAEKHAKLLKEGEVSKIA